MEDDGRMSNSTLKAMSTDKLKIKYSFLREKQKRKDIDFSCVHKKLIEKLGREIKFRGA